MSGEVTQQLDQPAFRVAVVHRLLIDRRGKNPAVIADQATEQTTDLDVENQPCWSQVRVSDSQGEVRVQRLECLADVGNHLLPPSDLLFERASESAVQLFLDRSAMGLVQNRFRGVPSPACGFSGKNTA